MVQNKKLDKRKAGIRGGLVVGLVFAFLASLFLMPHPVLEQDSEESWHVVWEGNLASAEASPAGGNGFCSFFCLDYAEVPGTVLQGNATDWSAAANVSGYVDTNEFNEDLKSDDPFYFVCRCRFGKDTCYDEGDAQFVDTRCRCTLTVSGDEIIGGVAGTRVVSWNETDGQALYINFYWDDGDNGYRITDDGTITVSSILIEAKY